MLHTASARLYAARWSLQSEEAVAIHLRPEGQSALLRALLLYVPLWLPWWLLSLVCAVVCPHLDAREITDGNVNYSFVVEGRNEARIFIKQAEAYLKWQPQMALERERMQREVQYFRDVAAALGEHDAARYLPRIYDFDLQSTTFVMEYLDGFIVAFDQIFAIGRVSRAAAAGLGEFMARVHARTLDRGQPEDKVRASAYSNPSMRAIQKEHVYEVCLEKSARGRELARDEPLMAEVQQLKAKYLGRSFDELDRFALCHGDFHPGGVMVRGGAVKVIDPEFVVCGPPGLDVGSLMSGFVLGFIYHKQQRTVHYDQLYTSPRTPSTAAACASGGASGGGAGAAGAACGAGEAVAAEEELLELHAALRAMWEAYEATMTAEGVSKAQLQRVSEDSAGYAMMEVLRTSLGFAGARDPSRRISDAAELERYQDVAVQLVRTCLLGRRGPPTRDGDAMRGVPLLLELLETLDVAALRAPDDYRDAKKDA